MVVLNKNHNLSVVHVNTLLHGGASIAAQRIHQSVRSQGINSAFYFGLGATPPDESFKRIIVSPTKKKGVFPFKKLHRYINKRNMKIQRARADYFLKDRPQDLGPFEISSGRPYFDLSLLHRKTILHLHWIANLFDYSYFFSSISQKQPIVWTLHDMNPFTGGCFHAHNCGGYKKECGNCPQLNNSSFHDLSRDTHRIKQKCYSGMNLHIVAVSNWMERKARESSLFHKAKSIRTIHHGIDTSVFTPRNKETCKEALGIDNKKFVIAFGCDSHRRKEKGLFELLSALDQIEKINEFVLVIFGNQAEYLNRNNVLQLGYVHAPELLTTIYSAADVFVLPSQAESFGLVVAEASACGTPVIAFNVGGIPDIVTPGESGILVERGDSGEFADAVKWILHHREEREAMGRAAREIVENKFTLEKQASAYKNLYTELANEYLK